MTGKLQGEKKPRFRARKPAESPFRGLDDFASPFGVKWRDAEKAAPPRKAPKWKQHSAEERAALLAELEAHRDEAGYGWQLAEREKMSEETVRGWLRKAGMTGGAWFRLPGAEGKAGNAARAKSFEEAHPVTAEDLAAAPADRCGFTGQRCKRARRCEYNLAYCQEWRHTGAKAMRVNGRVEVCSRAVVLAESSGPVCRACSERARCGEAWSCWLLEHDGEGRDLMALLDREGRRREARRG